MLTQDHVIIQSLREWGAAIPDLVEFQVVRNAESGLVPLILGGDHSLTYYAVRGLLRQHPRITVVHFDAHHDRYSEPHWLTHYNVIRLIEDELNCPVVSVGLRHDVEPAELALPTLDGGPIYITVDADFFDPAIIAAVADVRPIVESLTTRPDVDTFVQLLGGLSARIVGADIVEWCGADSQSAEFAAMAEIRAELAFRILENWRNQK